MPANPISCHLITWGKDLDTGLRDASALGYRACETFTDRALAYEDRPQAFAELLALHDLKLSALYAGGGRFADPAQAEAIVALNVRVARFLAALGVDRIVLGPGGPRNGKSSPDELKQMASTINESAKRTAELGVLACVHPHLFTEIQDRDEIDAVLTQTDPNVVFFCPDTAHLAGAGIDPATIIRDYGERVRYFHLKDLTPKDPDPSKFAVASGTEALPIFCELGLGTIDFHPIMAALDDIGYTDWLTVEIDKSTSTPYESLLQCRDFLQNELHFSVSRTR